MYLHFYFYLSDLYSKKFVNHNESRRNPETTHFVGDFL